MEKNNNVRFIRKNGRVIPIRVKKGSGSRGGPMKAERNTKQKVGRAAMNVGAATALTAVFRSPIARGLNKIGSSLASKGRMNAAYQVGRAGKAIESNPSKLVYTSLGATATGAVSSSYGNKQRAKETRMLNKGRKKKY